MRPSQRTTAGTLFLFALAASRAAAQTTTPVAARTLARGATLTQVDIDTGFAPDSEVSALIGWVTRRIIRQGEPLKVPAVEPPVLVRTGTMATVRAVVDGVSAERTGIALSDAALGTRVRVRLDAGRTITGTVTGPALVRLP
jgi:flagellar basal body P-ring formation protein FlgA